MALLLHVNEASVSELPSREASDEVVAAFAALLLAVRRRRGDAALVSSFPLSEVALFEHHTLGEWGSRAANRDRWRVVRLMQSRSPGWHRDRDDEASEYCVGGDTVVALGDAHMSEGLLVSFRTSGVWDLEWVEGTRTYLVELDGEIQLKSEGVQVRHGSVESHLDAHLEWVSTAGTAEVESGADLQSKCGEMFTKLKFLPRAEDQLKSLDPKWVAPVAQTLALLNRALVEWSPSSSHPSWYTHVTADSQSRRAEGLMDFRDLDGTVRTFDTHARFTPGHGRIHFKLDTATRTATVAHVGHKLL
ncbi:MAG: hypothetical protein DI566_12085 [Microbacterium sp.]|nr:MAG: hypothetical protein DI566_12085 [Microbacterium sp.]